QANAAIESLSMDPFSNPVWTALTTMQSAFAEGSGKARRFLPEVTKLAAVEDESEQSFRDMADVLRNGQSVGIRLSSNLFPSFGPLQKVPEFRVALMIQKKATDHVDPKIELKPLGAEHSPQMQALAELTQPGPFGPRTHELGNY